MRIKISLIFAVFLGLFISAFFATAQYDPSVGIQDRVWLLKGDRTVIEGQDVVQAHGIVAVVILPYPVRSEVVSAAWSYAVQQGADGLDLPNYYRAVEILMERHPTWVAATTRGYTINYSSERAATDTQDPTLTPMAQVIIVTATP